MTARAGLVWRCQTGARETDLRGRKLFNEAIFTPYLDDTGHQPPEAPPTYSALDGDRQKKITAPNLARRGDLDRWRRSPLTQTRGRSVTCSNA
jgi:hypothetical protein